MRYLSLISLVICGLLSGPARGSDAPVEAGSVMPGGLGLSATGVPQAMGLKGLWALHASADIGVMSNDDVRGFFPEGALTLPDRSAAYGFSLRLQRHMSDALYLGLGFDSLSKSYELRASGVNIVELYQFNGIQPALMIGTTFGRGENSFFFAELQAGLLVLNQSSFEQQGGSNITGDFTGSTTSTLASLGANWFVIPSVGLHLSLGWRQAKVKDMKFTLSDGSQVNPTFTPAFFADFSGPQGHLGITFYWGMENPWGEMHKAPEPPRNLPEE